jgi:hypothetical protein
MAEPGDVNKNVPCFLGLDETGEHSSSSALKSSSVIEEVVSFQSIPMSPGVVVPQDPEKAIVV